MKNIIRIIPAATILLGITTAALVAACGGGGGSASFNAPPVSITTANAPQVSASTVNLTANVGNAGGQAGGGVTTSSVVQRSRGLNLAGRVMAQFGRLSSDIGLPKIQSLTVKAMGASTSPCAISGSYSISSSSNASGSITFFSCIDTPGEIVNGTMTLSGLTGTGNPPTAPWSASGRIGFSNFNVVSDHAYLMNGSGNVAINVPDATTEEVTISGSTITVSVDSKSNTLSGFTVDISENTVTHDYTMDIRGTLSSTLLEGSVTFETVTPFTGNDVASSNPQTGKLVITGANNSSVTLTAIDSTNVKLEVDADGDGAVDADGTSTVLWSDVDATL